MYGYHRGRPDYANMVTVGDYDLNQGFHAYTSATSRDAGLEAYYGLSPNPDQDCMQAQGVSPGLGSVNSEPILARSTTEQQQDLRERRRAVDLMESREIPWNALASKRRRHDTQIEYYPAAFLPEPYQGYMDQQNQAFPPTGPPYGFGEPAASSASQQHGFYSSSGSSPTTQDNHGEKPKGGRQPGMNLTPAAVNNARLVRHLGACLRCRILRERCSDGDPCLRCAETHGRKWKGCFRSMRSLGDALVPPMLADRLRRPAFENYMTQNTHHDVSSMIFRLPLSFGFGPQFDGFLGREFIPSTDESDYSYAVFSSREGHRSHHRSHALFIYPLYSSESEVNSLLIKWLKKTVTDPRSMREWRNFCFQERRDRWMRDLLEKIWEYSATCWQQRDSRYHDIDETLAHTWMLTLLATMLSISITVPPDALQAIFDSLAFSDLRRPNVSRSSISNSSRPINRCVKGILLAFYEKIVSKVMTKLDELIKSSKKVDEREWGHIYCISILLVIVVSQTQMSLWDNYKMAETEGRRGQWEKTSESLEQLEEAYTHITLVSHWKYKQTKTGKYRDGSYRISDSLLRSLVDGILRIRRTHGPDVYRSLKDELQVGMDAGSGFDASMNTQRLFGVYFNLIYPEQGSI
ncbi:hypothetical protein BGW36DRAFT_356936 [Talaromyces proteolyticus]|uniref:Zn(2)-C6 fungal-type domain-containing protein n=1 Tax=Talaromyces proteolyticus TaxID=1131652 RepID=A0AAD4KST9_9EURO|nr:uncharacterized protein BGW36DRAFT_356936 [Talaromyces proteolyticus]KAH8700273.1 hypothetical protein BGW36DRAFT_356936 [Talaromyces proteolyticus]